jgi:hydrogenase expression/formation protein HypE
LKKRGQIMLGHGDGGRLTRRLIEEIFAQSFSNPALAPLADAALLSLDQKKIAFTTDSYVVKPIFFPGSDIGKLAVFGTCNDLAVMGARPRYLSSGFILEEGLEIETLERVVGSMRESAEIAGVKLVTGDTKVVERGSADKIFINTAGIGELLDWPSMGAGFEPGDEILISGAIGDHGVAILAARGELNFSSPVESDCGPVWPMVMALHGAGVEVKWMRDPTRGGVASALNELCEGKNFGVQLLEEKIPVRKSVSSACEILGLDPLYLANEGKLIAVVKKGLGEKAKQVMASVAAGSLAERVGELIANPAGKVIIRTQIRGTRVLAMMAGAPLPRIC